MALPGLHDLLPDHIFHDPSPAAHPPPPSSILPHPPPSYPYYRPPPHTVPLRPLASDFAPPPPEYPYSTRQAYSHADSAFSDGGFPVDDRIDRRLERHYADEIDYDNTSEGIGEAEGEKRKHACSMCGKRFNRPSSLRIHLNTHTGAKPYICPFPGCSRSFNVSSNMRRHYRNHARRVPPPIPIDVSQARGSQSQTQIHQVSAPVRVQRGFSVEPPAYLRGRSERHHQKGRAGLPSTSGSRPASSDGDNMGSTIRGAEAAARAAMKESVGSGSTTDTLAQYAYPYPPMSHYVPPPPPLSSAYSRDILHAYDGQQRQAALTYPPTSNSTIYTEERIFDSETQYHRQYNVPAPSAASPMAYRAEYERRTSYDGRIPPTPPHTNEAALSPPSYAPPLLYASNHPPMPFPSGYDGPSHSVRDDQDREYESGHGYLRNDPPRYAGLGTAREYSHNTDETHMYRSYHSVSSERTETEPSTYLSHHGHLPHTSDWEKYGDRHAPSYASGYDDYHHTQKRPLALEESRAISEDRHSIPASRDNRRDNEPNSELGRGRIVESAIRQQPSPDTPSLHVSELHSSFSQKNEEEKGENALRVEEIEITRECDQEAPRHTRSRSGGLHLHDLIHPAPQEPQHIQAMPSASSKPRQECYKVTSPTVTRSSGQGPTAPTASPRERPELRTDSKSETVGQTPGAAPPPPYPLYSLPPSTSAEDNDEVENTAEPKRNSSGGRHVGRATKRRRRG